VRQTVRREFLAAQAPGGIAVAGLSAARRDLAQIVSGSYAGSAFWGHECSRGCARKRQPGGDGGGDSSWSVDRASAQRTPGGGGGAHRRRHSCGWLTVRCETSGKYDRIPQGVSLDWLVSSRNSSSFSIEFIARIC